MSLRFSKLRDVATIERKGVIPSNMSASTPYVGLEHIDTRNGITSMETVSTADVRSTKFQFTTSHILFGKLRPYLCKIARPSFDGVCSTDILPILPKPNLCSGYLYHFLRTPDQVELATRRSSGANLPRLSPKELAEFQIPLPPLEEQKRIAGILDAADALRQKRRQALAELDTFLQSTFLDLFGDPVTNPKGWEVVKIGDLMESVNYGTSKKADIEENGYPILRMNNITYSGGWDFKSLKYIDLTDKEAAKYLVHKGQILFNRTNSKELVGKTAVYREDTPMAFAGYLVRGIVNSKNDPEYIGAFMNTPQIKQHLQNMCKNIVGMANINAKEFQGIPIPKPPLDLQQRFADIVTRVEAQKAHMRAQLTELDTLFASLQQRAFNGEL